MDFKQFYYTNELYLRSKKKATNPVRNLRWKPKKYHIGNTIDENLFHPVKLKAHALNHHEDQFELPYI